MTREDRQRGEIGVAFDRGDWARVVVLAREHLVEYPEDSVVRDLAERAGRLRDPWSW